MWRALHAAWLRWRISATDQEVLLRSRDGSLSSTQAINYMRVADYWADQLRALERR